MVEAFKSLVEIAAKALTPGITAEKILDGQAELIAESERRRAERAAALVKPKKVKVEKQREVTHTYVSDWTNFDHEPNE